MRISMRYLTFSALGAAFMATPALAQLGLGGQAGAGLGVGVNAGGAVGGVMNGATGTLDRTVNATDRAVNGALDRDLTLATSADLASGAVVRYRRGAAASASSSR